MEANVVLIYVSLSIETIFLVLDAVIVEIHHEISDLSYVILISHFATKVMFAYNFDSEPPKSSHIWSHWFAYRTKSKTLNP
jgi:hypothetical protein